MPQRSYSLQGILWVLCSSTCFGIMPLFAHIAYGAGCDPIGLLWIRFNLAAIVLWIIVLTQRLPLPRPRHCFLLMAIGGIYVLQALCYFTALTLIPASLVSLLLYLYPAIVAGLSILFLGEPRRPRTLMALGLALAGVGLTVGIEAGKSALGLTLGLLMPWLYALYILAVSRILAQGRSALAGLTWVMTGCGLLYSGLMGIRGGALPQTGAGWGAVVIIAIVCTVLAVVTFFIGVQSIGATVAATLSTWEPVVTVFTAVLFLGDRLSPWGFLGGGFILGAVLLISTENGSTPKASIQNTKSSANSG